jgi:hypothetical protein
MVNYEIAEQVLKLHDIARVLESEPHLQILAADLRKLADQVNRVYTNHVAAGKLDPVERDYLEYLSSLGQ